MGKERGFYATRKREARRRLLLPPVWFWPVALVALLWLIAGATRAWPQSSGSSLNSSSDDLTTWELLSRRFSQDLEEQSTRLQQALTEMQTSKASSETLMFLLEQSLTANEDLKNYNGQITERLQTRDEDLAAAYGKTDRLEKTLLKVIIALVAAVAAAVVLLIILIRG